MKFDELESRMRVFETAGDRCVVPGMYMVARIDGRSFTRLTRETHKFEAPYDEKFRDYMVGTVESLFDCGFKVVYGYTQSDEISLLFDLNETSFGRKIRKYNSVLAGHASAAFSLALGALAVFDCRLSELPGPQYVVDYFRWRSEDAHRNALNGHCYWALRKKGMNQKQATVKLSGMPVAAKNELLFQNGVNFNNLPKWQKRGIGVYWEEVEKPARNRKTGEDVIAVRRKIRVNYDLPMKDDYDALIKKFLD